MGGRLSPCGLVTSSPNFSALNLRSSGSKTSALNSISEFFGKCNEMSGKIGQVRKGSRTVRVFNLHNEFKKQKHINRYATCYILFFASRPFAITCLNTTVSAFKAACFLSASALLSCSALSISLSSTISASFVLTGPSISIRFVSSLLFSFLRSRPCSCCSSSACSCRRLSRSFLSAYDERNDELDVLLHNTLITDSSLRSLS